MVNGIALKFFNYITAGGPCDSGDRYQQIRIDSVWDTISGYIEIDAGLTAEEKEYIEELDNFDELEEALTALLDANLES